MDGEMSQVSIPTIHALLGIRVDAPLTFPDLIASLTVSFFPTKPLNGRLGRFWPKLQSGLRKHGVKILDFEDALAQGQNGKVNKGVVLIAAPDFIEGDPPTHFVSSLSANIIVGVYDKPSPLTQHTDQQARLDLVIGQMVWDIVQVLIYVEDDTWTVCNMNGAMVPSPNCDVLTDSILEILISKLAAPVIPPRMADFQVRPQSFNPADVTLAASVSDLVECGPIWEQTGLFFYQTPLAKLKFRNDFMRRLGTKFVDHRSGMSFGFLVRQVPQIVRPALTLAEARQQLGDFDWIGQELHVISGQEYLAVNIGAETLIVEAPDVWVLCTRSGCIKTRLDPRRDVIRLGLSKGQYILETPAELEPGSDCKPSYDTGVILAHALANVVIASVLARFNPESEFLKALQTTGLALAHWHGYLAEHERPSGCAVFGRDNIPFACATPQSTILAFQGKLSAFESQFCNTRDYHGDIHVEPHHGTNMTGNSLTGIARWLLGTKQAAPLL
jgi:hypothetical protein